MNASGPKAEPCITLAEMGRGLEVNPLNLVWCARPPKKFTIQL